MSLATNKKALAIGSAALLLLASASFGFAQEQPPVVLTTGTGFLDLMRTILGWMFSIFMILAVIMLIWAAFLYLTAGGDEAKADKAKNVIIYAVIAIVIAMLAAGIPQVIQSVLSS